MTLPPSSPTGSDADPLAGRLLAGRYRLERPIASGGMAQVWEALDQLLARRVAVKVLHPHLARDASFVERFRAEAVAAARLSHPSIVSVYDTCSEDGIEAIVMELVSGTTVRADLDEHGPMRLPAVLAIGTQVADALGAAHAAGLVHRDVKPANILLSADGRVLVADFGIAKAAEAHDLTAAGAMVGTAKYLAPEQVEDGPIDGRADLYALGVVLYEALAGEPPFVGDTDASTALARLHREPRPLRDLRPEVPEPVAAVVHQAMQRDRSHRFASAAAMRAALLAAGAEPARAPGFAAAAAASAEAPVAAPAATATPPPPPPAPPARPTPPVAAPAPAPEPRPTDRPRRWPAALALVVVALIAAGAVVALRPGPAGSAPLAIGSAAAFDPPPGDGTEHDDQAAFAIDDDPTTAWTSESYRDPVTIAGKGGVGLVLTLDATGRVDGIDVQSAEGGWDASVYATTGDRPADLAGWGEPLAATTSASSGTTALRFRAVEADAVLVWFTRLPSSGAVSVSRVTVRGR
ncbi:MAG TPA: protein kinase [Aquihabitans sp.]|nr:protein kinase [Aquihabitans sp.]